MTTLSRHHVRHEIGRSMPRGATRRFAAGDGRCLDDVSVKGELHAAFLRSPHGQSV
jgi:carbon-monoxide dehydrogenase large subunit